jgi:hypothetical protein
LRGENRFDKHSDMVVLYLNQTNLALNRGQKHMEPCLVDGYTLHPTLTAER